ncbi:MAG: hypothetical protein U9R41_01665 [Candidatus Marinimicrobia bacterium]|nr:hypothetical protein [Candidatus Neomarinimicrobiota bacterium]
MKKIILILVIFSSIALYGQFNDDNSEFSTGDLGLKINNNNDMASFLNISNLQMQHSISMSMGNSSLGSESYVSYHNRFFIPFSDKLNLSGDVILRQQAFSSNPMMQALGEQNNGIYFNTNLEYQLSEDSKISIGFSNIPRYNYNHYYYGVNSLWNTRIQER